MGRTSLARASIVELKRRILIAERRKKYLEEYLHNLWNSYQKSLISRDFYVETAYRHFDGKTLKEWIDYYEHYIGECKRHLRKHRKDRVKGHFATLVFSALIIFLALFIISKTQIQLPITGFVSFNVSDNRTIGYEFLDDGKVVHIWNTQDDYFFNKSSGIQFSNHYQDYWTRNIFCIGYYDGEEWVKIKCADELSDFNRIIDTDNSTYVNATLWKDITYEDYDLRLGINYYLGLNDKNLTITIYGKNIGIDIPFDLGFVWRIKDTNVGGNVGYDIIKVNDTKYDLSDDLNLVFKNLSKSYYTIFDNRSGKYLTLTWNENLNYKLLILSEEGQYNAPVNLAINVGSFLAGQEKSTKMYWIDASTWSSKLLFPFDDDDGAPATYTAEILDTNDDKPDFGGTLTKFAVRIYVTTGKNLDAADGTQCAHCEDSGCADSYNIGSLVGTQLNTPGTFWINSTDTTLLARIEHNGAEDEHLNCWEIGTISGGENLNYNSYVYFEYNPPPLFSSPAENDSDIFQGDYVNHTINISENPDGYIFSWNASGASCGTWVNSSWIDVSGSSVTVGNASVIPNECTDKTIGWRFWANNSIGISASDVETYAVNSYGWLNVSISKPDDNSEWYQNDANLTINVSVTCQGGTNAVCGTVEALARYNLSSSPDTAINTTKGALPFYIISEAWDLSLASYDNVNISTQDSHTYNLFFKSDGTKLYETGGNTDSIYQYTCSDAWNLSSCEYDEGVNISTQGLSPTGLFFKSDGTKLYEMDLFERIFQYSCSDAWNLSSCDYDNVNISKQNANSYGLFFKSDGTKLYEMGLTSVRLIYQYTCSDPWNLSSCDYDNVNIPTLNYFPQGLFFKSDGTKLYEIGSNPDMIHQSSCSDAWNLSSCEDDNVNISTLDSTPQGLFFKSDGTKLYELGANADLIYQYSLEMKNPKSKSLSKDESWNVSWVLNVTTASTESYLIDVLFNSSYGNSSVQENDTENKQVNLNPSAEDTDSPQWFDNSTNGTTAGTYIEHRVRWTDTALSGYIFEFDNGTGTFNNDSFVTFTGTNNWSNVSKVVNSTEGSTIRWRVYVNDTASPTNWNSTDIFIYTTSANNPPTIDWVETIDPIGPAEDTTRSITFNFTATDADGYTNINVSTAEARFQLTDEATRSNLSCINWSQSGDDVNFTCTIDMWYFDKADTGWKINVTIKDINDADDENSSTNFSYTSFMGMKMSPTSLEWPEINLTDIDIGSSNDPILINNTGNDEPLNINVTALDLRGEQYTSYYIYAANFTVENASDGCSGLATAMSNDTSINVTSAILYRGNHSLNYKNATSGQEELFFCLKEIPSENPAQSYSSSAFGAWEIRILLVAVIPAGRRRKKKLKKRKEITENLSIPATIFSENIGALETVTKYLRENLGMSYHEIARYLNRDERTIWTAYQKAVQKQHQMIEAKETKMFLPVSILRNRKLTVLESIIVYIKSKEMKYSEIAEIIERDQRNVRTAYQKAVNKLKEREFKDLIKTEAELIIPATIFSKELGVLESLVKYMKENLNMSYKEIAEKLGRDKRTIWTVYKKSKEKQKGPIKPKETKMFLPISIFKDERLTILKSIILYLKSKGFKFSEIAKLLERDQRNIWTVYSRTKKKVYHKNNNI